MGCCIAIHRYPFFSTRYSVMCKVYTGYCGTSEIEHGLCACTVDNPLAKARALSLRTGAQTMLYLSLVIFFLSLIVYLFFLSFWGWSGGAMVLGKIPVPGRPTIWMTEGQGPIALAVGAGGGCLDIFTLAILSLLFLPLCLVDGPIWTEILSQRAAQPKTTNQQISLSGKRPYCPKWP